MTVVQISGMPATGKTFGVKSLDPKKTFFIDCDKKGMSWAGWKKDYSVENKNYAPVSDIPQITTIISSIIKNRPEITAIVVDTITSAMIDKEVAESKRVGFDKWADLTKLVYELYDYLRTIDAPNVVCFIMSHIEPYEVEGVTHFRTKTVGQKLTKINLNSKLNYNLYTKVVRDGKEMSYKLVTQNEGNTEARSPYGVLEFEIDNNLEEIKNRILETES